jgi:two-component system OmpR family response regulator
VVSIYISIVEGNPHLRSLLAWHLQQAGYLVNQSATLQSAASSFPLSSTNLSNYRFRLAKRDGIELCRWLYQQKQSLILILSAAIAKKTWSMV